MTIENDEADGRAGEAGRKDPDPLAAFVRFHARIRRATPALVDLLGAPLLDPDRRARAAALARFIRGPLAWHDFDEEVYLLPRIRPRVSSPADREAVETCSRWHEQMEGILQSLIPHLHALSGGGRARAPRVVVLRAATLAQAVALTPRATTPPATARPGSR